MRSDRYQWSQRGRIKTMRNGYNVPSWQMIILMLSTETYFEVSDVFMAVIIDRVVITSTVWRPVIGSGENTLHYNACVYLLCSIDHSNKCSCLWIVTRYWISNAKKGRGREGEGRYIRGRGGGRELYREERGSGGKGRGGGRGNGKGRGWW